MASGAVLSQPNRHIRRRRPTRRNAGDSAGHRDSGLFYGAHKWRQLHVHRHCAQLRWPGQRHFERRHARPGLLRRGPDRRPRLTPAHRQRHPVHGHVKRVLQPRVSVLSSGLDGKLGDPAAVRRQQLELGQLHIWSGRPQRSGVGEPCHRRPRPGRGLRRSDIHAQPVLDHRLACRLRPEQGADELDCGAEPDLPGHRYQLRRRHLAVGGLRQGGSHPSLRGDRGRRGRYQISVVQHHGFFDAVESGSGGKRDFQRDDRRSIEHRLDGVRSADVERALLLVSAMAAGQGPGGCAGQECPLRHEQSADQLVGGPDPNISGHRHQHEQLHVAVDRDLQDRPGPSFHARGRRCREEFDLAYEPGVFAAGQPRTRRQGNYECEGNSAF